MASKFQMRGEARLRGPEVWGPLRGLGIRPLVSVIRGLGNPFPEAPKRLPGFRGRLFRGLGEVCPFSKERGKKVGHSEAPKRPRFPGCPLRGFQPSGSYPQATDKNSRKARRGEPPPQQKNAGACLPHLGSFGLLGRRLRVARPHQQPSELPHHQACERPALLNGPESPKITITHKMITEPNFIIFELFSVISAL